MADAEYASQNTLRRTPEQSDSQEVGSALIVFDAMAKYARYWEFDQHEYRRIIPLIEDETLLGLLDFLMDLRSEWSTLEDWLQWLEIQKEVLARLEELDLFQKLGITLLCAPPGRNGKPVMN